MCARTYLCIRLVHVCLYNVYSFIHYVYFYSASSSQLLLGGAPDYSIDTVSELTRRSASEGLAQGPYVEAGVGFEPATLWTQRTEIPTEPPRLTCACIHVPVRVHIILVYIHSIALLAQALLAKRIIFI